MGKHNLLQDDFASFTAVFDIYTPRPHFIILPKEGESIELDVSRMTNEQTRQLIKAGKYMLERYKINGGILSIHCGAWRSQKDKIHLHFCVDVESYVRVFENYKGIIPKWPNKRYVTKEWRLTKDPLSYVENVRGYPYRSYLDQEVKTILENSSHEHGFVVGQRQFHCAITQIIFHPSHPKIGFVGNKMKSVEELQQGLLAIEKLAKELDLTVSEPNDENHGCHVCLYFGSVSTADWNFTSDDGQDVVGHIVMAGFRFYQLCPGYLREDWFQAYRESNFKCLT